MEPEGSLPGSQEPDNKSNEINVTLHLYDTDTRHPYTIQDFKK
jgi:hypothetical protein